jgi:hypothetical protein
MRLRTFIIFLSIVVSLSACRNKLEEKGFAVSSSDDTEDSDVPGIAKDSIRLSTRPSNVLLTGHSKVRLTTIYKVNYNRDSTTFIGSNDYHGNYDDIGRTNGNVWHYNLMPGFESVYGYNLVNISHYNVETNARKNFFGNPVLLKTFYYPSFSKDTLYNQPVTRGYFMTSVYDEDTNKDGFINVRDLRRIYYFDINAENKRALVPNNYSVYKSEYDPDNDFMYVFAQLDENGNGKIDELEPINVFWIDLKKPERTGRQY